MLRPRLQIQQNLKRGGLKVNIAKIITAIIAILLFAIAAALISSSFNLLKTSDSLIDVGLAAIASAFTLITAIIFILVAAALLYLILELHTQR